MKKFIFSLFLLCLMIASVSAVPQMPYIMYGQVDWNNQLLAGARLDVVNNGNTEQITTNDGGYWVYQLSEYTVGNTVTITVTDGCGTGDTCSKSVVIGSTGNEDYAVVDFSITGDMTCPPCNCQSCDCGGGSSGSYVDLATEDRCAEKFPCGAEVCPTEKVCPEEKECTETECQDVVCDECEVCEECATDEQDNSVLAYLLGAIGLIVGGGSIYYLKRKDAKMPNGTFLKFGGAGTKHLHRGIRGYHDPATSHREAHERHPKGELDPKYEKDANGVYKYVD